MNEKIIGILNRMTKERLIGLFTLNRILLFLLLLFAGTLVFFAAKWIESYNTIVENEIQLGILQATVTADEDIIRQLEAQNNVYVSDIADLTALVNDTENANAGLVAEKDELIAKKTELEQTNSQLKATNGDLSKKFRILSGPS